MPEVEFTRIFGAKVFREIGLACDCCIQVMKSNLMVFAQDEKEAEELIRKNVRGITKVIRVFLIAEAGGVSFIHSVNIGSERVVWRGCYMNEALKQYRG